MSPLDNATIIARIEAWQSAWVHPLTCGNDSEHAKLEPVEQDGQVILTCRDCDYRQEQIPSIVIEHDASKFRKKL